MSEEIREKYMELWVLCTHHEYPLLRKYRALRESFERTLREQVQPGGLQATDLAARINYLVSQYSFDYTLRNALHTFRLTSNEVLNRRKEPVEEEFQRDVRTVAEAYSRMFETVIPKELEVVLPDKLASFQSKN